MNADKCRANAYLVQWAENDLGRVLDVVHKLARDYAECSRLTEMEQYRLDTDLGHVAYWIARARVLLHDSYTDHNQPEEVLS